MHKGAKVAIILVYSFSSLLILGLVNFQMISGWFGGMGPANIGSIEVSYVTMARFLRDFGLPFPGGPSWIPLWYLGFPYNVFYTPLLPFLEYLLNSLFDINLWSTYRFLTGLAYILAPISVFFLGWQLSKKIIGGLLSGLFYSVGPTIFYFILKSGEVFQDRISADFLDPRRFTILVRWGEGPHLFSLIFVPLAGVFFARLLEKPRFINLLGVSIFLGLTALTNAVGLSAAALLIFIMVFVKLATSQANKLNILKYFFSSGFLTFGLISFWYNLTFLSTFFEEGGGSSGFLVSAFPWGWLIGILALTFIYFLLKKFIKSFGIGVCLFWFLALFAVVATYYFSAPPEESFRRIEILPQALRLNTEVDLALSLLLGVSFASIFKLIGKKFKLVELTGDMLGLAIVFLLVIYIQAFVPVAKQAASHSVDLSSTSEKKIADWLDQNVDTKSGERVFAPGNYGFYLNWYSNVSQLRGGLYQASINPWPDHIYYQLANGKDPAIINAWFIASNIKYVLITTPGSGELYKEIKNPDRFSSMQSVYEQSGDIIYEVPLKRPPPAKPVSIQPVKTLKAPVKADDKENLLVYADWVENSSANNLEFKMLSHDSYSIKGKVDDGEAVLVQMTADSGWSASDRGSGIKTSKDPLGFLVFYPKPGQVDITLERHTSWQEWLGYITSLVTIGFMIGYRLFGRKKYN